MERPAFVSEQECYRILGIKPGATHSEIMHAYRVLAKYYHPDSASGKGNASAFVRVVNAYQSLVGRKHAAGTGARQAAQAARTAARGPAYRSAAPKGAAPRKPAASWSSSSKGAGARGSAAKGPASRGSASKAGESAWSSARRPAAGWTAAEKPAPPKPKPRTREPGMDVFALGRALLFHPEPLMRIRAAGTLGESGKKSSYAFLRKAFWDRNDQVRSAAVRAVGSLGIRQAGGELASLFSKASVGLKMEVLAAVMKIGCGNEFRSVLALALRDDNTAVRRAARAVAGSTA